jgi:uracil-DNA glycosylase
MTAIERFTNALARVAVSDRARNQYARGDRNNAIRRDNLRLYLEEIGSPTTLMIGEAPSYRGGRLTGIAFTSETIMLAGIAGHLGEHRGYRKATTGPQRSTEASATMVWGTIGTIRPLPLLWNAFPFHPFHEGNPLSNRMPAAGELLAGQPFIERLMEMFPIEQVIAVGNHAHRSLEKLAIEHVHVRHPSQGGKNAFVAGVTAMISQRIEA